MSQKPNKYIRRINAVDDFSGFMSVDVYAVLEAFNVTCPAGLRGAKDSTQDLEEARDSITRSIQLEMQRVRQNEEH